MRMEYLAIGVLFVVAAIIIYLIGERTWGIKKPKKGSVFAFFVYRKVNRIKVRDRDYKESILLSFMKVGPQITGVPANFNTAQYKLNRSTKLSLIDIYDDYQGHRYIKVNTPRYGVFIFEISEYMKVSLDTRVKDRILNLAPKEASEETAELETRPLLKVVKLDKK